MGLLKGEAVVQGYPNYAVSVDGHVRNTCSNRVLTPMLTGRKTYQRSMVNLRGVIFSVAELVLTAFVGPRPTGYHAMHLDDNPQNNAATNLKWGTPRENSRAAARTMRRTTQLLGPRQVVEIRARRCAGERGHALALEYGVSDQRICDIYKGRTAL